MKIRYKLKNIDIFQEIENLSKQYPNGVVIELPKDLSKFKILYEKYPGVKPCIDSINKCIKDGLPHYKDSLLVLGKDHNNEINFGFCYRSWFMKEKDYKDLKIIKLKNINYEND